MSAIQSREVAAGDAGLRLDRWFKRHFPGLGHGRLEKMLRTGQVRVDGARAKAGTRLEAGQSVRIPPMPEGAASPRIESAARPVPRLDDATVREVRSWVLHRNAAVIVINKPAGLATQGGTGQTTHLDALLDALRFDAPERPRLVHRLDKDTSGVLLLGRSAPAAARLAEAFRQKSAKKIYWALTAGVPKPRAGKIDLALAKRTVAGGERMMADAEDGKRAVSLYQVLEAAPPKAAWLALWPLTGRTHQLRVHCAALGTPIVGDRKYGGEQALLTGAISRKLHLHARRIVLPHPDGGMLDVSAPLPRHMVESWRLLGFDPDDDRDPFPDVE